MARFIEKQLGFDYVRPREKMAWHYGLQELRELLDFIYGDKPTCEDEELN